MICKYFLLFHRLLFFFKNFLISFFFIGVKLLYNVVLVSAVQWSESAICISVFPLSWTSLQPPHPTHLGRHRAPSWAPFAISRFPPASYFTFGSVYMSMPLSHFVPAYPSPSPCPQVHSLCLPLYSCPATRFISTIFFLRFHIYVLAYGICFSLSDLLYSGWQTLGPSTSLQITQFRFFLWLSNIPLYICATSSLSIRLSMHS